MKLVLDSLEAANIESSYGVIINKVPNKDLAAATRKNEEQIEEELFQGLKPTKHILYLADQRIVRAFSTAVISGSPG